MVKNLKGVLRDDLRSRVTCPHCWESYAPEESMWLAAHPNLMGDPRLGTDDPKRFLPTRFTPEGNAIDPLGMACQDLACPKCHLVNPRVLLELPPLFVSIAGTPSCGKSYYLAAMTWKLRQTLPRDFELSYADADPASNLILNEYEEQQFLSARQDEVVKLAKTDAVGGIYDRVLYGGRSVAYPRPFLFAIRPTARHPGAGPAKRVSRLLCLYDNAGESFLPGRDTLGDPVTRHLGQSKAVLFCFDPTQDPRFRDACSGKSRDFQIAEAPVTARQETVLHEITNRVRQLTGMRQTDRRKEPLIIVVTKCDAWWSLMNNPNVPAPWRRDGDGPCSLDLTTIHLVSKAVRELLGKITPELVAAAEGFSEQTWFVPVSATGCSPEPVEKNGRTVWGVRPRNIRPMWCEVPMLLALATAAPDAIQVLKKAKPNLAAQGSGSNG